MNSNSSSNHHKLLGRSFIAGTPVCVVSLFPVSPNSTSFATAYSTSSSSVCSLSSSNPAVTSSVSFLRPPKGATQPDDITVMASKGLDGGKAFILGCVPEWH